MHDEPARLVALLIDHRTATWIAIQRACRMSDALEARLHVVLAIPRGTGTSHPVHVVSHVADLLRTRSPRRGHELEVVHGKLAEVGFEIARDESAVIVVVDSRFGAKKAGRLAHGLGIPVLVARDARADGDWIAASDMQHREYPVLSTARDLTRALDRELIYFHNARPLPVCVGDPMMAATTYAEMLKLQDDVATAKRARLDRLAGADAHVHSIVTRAGTMIEGLLDLARDRDADVVVVGHSPRSWWQRLLGRGTTERLVEQARRSVLIVPLDGRVG
jgi:nucleotide-binding universal stress UspA family protein